MSVQPFLLQRSAAQSAGISLVRNVLKKNSFPEGVTTRELYKLVTQEPPPENFTPFPVNVLGPQPAGPKMPKGRSPPNAKPRVLLSNRPEFPEHPIRSIRYFCKVPRSLNFLCLHVSRFLKEYVLPHLQGQGEIEMKRMPRALDTVVDPGTTKKERLAAARLLNNWAWKVIPPEERRTPPPPPKTKDIVGTEVGVGDDISHLNRRRTKARAGKVSRQVTKMKLYQNYKEERDQLLAKVEKNPYTLKKVSQSLYNNPDSDIGSMVWHEEQVRREMPKKFWADQPIEGAKAHGRLNRLRKHLAWNQPDILNR